MKKKVLTMALCLTMGISLTACGGQTANKDQAPTTSKSSQTVSSKVSSTTTNSTTSVGNNKNVASETKENATEDVIRWNAGTSGNVLLTIAEEKGFLKDEGIKIEFVPATANADAMTMLSTGKVDVVSNAGTSNPLQQISSGVDLTIFGGHMLTGAMPIIAKKGTKWEGVKSLIGKKFACNPAYFALTGAVMELGYDKPLEAVNWVTYKDYTDAMAAVVKGEVDFALQGTGQNFAVKGMDDIEIVAYQSDIMPNYSCCRMESTSDYFKNNKDKLKRVVKALIRAQEYYQRNREEAAKLHAAKIEADVPYVNAYMQDEHYRVHIDPLKNSVIRAWDILGKTGFLDEKAKNINIEDHVNTDLYKEALDEVIAAHYDENKEFYDELKKFFEENNTGL